MSVRGPGRAGLRYVLPFLARYRTRLLVVLALTGLGAALGLTYPFFLQKAVDRVFLSEGDVSRRLLQLRILAAVVFSVSIVQLVVSTCGSYLHTWVASHLLFDMRAALYRHLTALPVGFFTKTRVGEVQARLGADLAEVQAAATGALLQFVGSVLALAGALGFLVHYSVRLTAIALAFLPIALVLLLSFQRRIRSLAYRIRKENTDITSDVIETFGSVKTIKAFTAEEHRLEGFRGLNFRMIGSVLRFQVTSAFAAGVPGTVLIASSAVVFLVGGSMVLEGSLTVGALIACNVYLMRLFAPIQGMIGLYLRLQRARAALDRVFEFLRAGPVEPLGRGRPFERLEDGIELRNVTFGHDPAAPVLRGIDLAAPAGTMVAVVGRSGAGKTTLLDLLAGFVAPASGEIRLDGVPIGDYDVRSLRSRIGFVVQGGDLFSGTVEENVRIGRTSATAADLRRAVGVAGLEPVIARLGGLGGSIGERGSGLSAGERARVAIARAVLGDPEILLLDEAFGDLDPEARGAGLEALARAARGRTTFLVTHDAEVARRADSVLFLTADGRAVAGRHDSLEREDGAYRSLLGGEAPAVRIALVDSGVNRSHPHVGRITGGRTVGWDEGADAPTVRHDGAPDTIGHGTACAGVIHEVAPGAEIVPIRVFEDCLRTRTDVLRAALREAMGVRPRIVHLSLGVASPEAAGGIEDACREAESRGIVVVSTAIDGRRSMPGGVPTVIAVGADPRLGRREVAGGSGEGVDLVADPWPRDIPGAPPGANMSGPSFAAARVSGIVSSLLAGEPGLTPDEVRSRLRERFRPTGQDRSETE